MFLFSLRVMAEGDVRFENLTYGLYPTNIWCFYFLYALLQMEMSDSRIWPTADLVAETGGRLKTRIWR